MCSEVHRTKVLWLSDLGQIHAPVRPRPHHNTTLPSPEWFLSSPPSHSPLQVTPDLLPVPTDSFCLF